MPAQHPQKTLADRVVAWFAPGAAVRRAQARAVLAYFEAARPDRLRKGRRATGSVNDDVLRAGSTLREIARHMEQNYDLALGVLNTLVANVVGANGIGIEPQPRNADGSINDDLARQILELLKDWATCPEVTRQHDWPSAQRMLARSWLRDGEVFAQLVAGLLPSLDHGTRVPFSLEMLEADYVPMGKQSSGPATINQGIEINAWGAPVAYHVLSDAPESAARAAGFGPGRSASRPRALPPPRCCSFRPLRRVAAASAATIAGAKPRSPPRAPKGGRYSSISPPTGASAAR